MSRMWYIYQDNIQKGPFTEEEMNHFIRSAGIKPHELAWSEGMDEWIRVEDIPDFYAALREAPGWFDYPEEEVVTDSHLSSEKGPAAPPEPPPPPAQDYKPKPDPAVVSDTEEESLLSSSKKDKKEEPQIALAKKDKKEEPQIPPAKKDAIEEPQIAPAKEDDIEEPLITPVNKDKKKSPVIVAILAVLLIGAGLLAYNLIADGPQEVAEEPAEIAGEEAAAPVGDESYLIAFDSNHLGTYDLFVIDLAGQRMVRLTETEEDSYEPAWSPDGSQILFTRYYPEEYESAVYIMDLASGNLTRISDPEGNYSYPAWSPDGKRIACAADPTGTYELDLWLMDPDGSDLTRLTEDLYVLAPAWSPDGSKIAFSVIEDFEHSEIYVIDISGDNLTQLTSIGGYNYYPAWSPDGSQIAFVSNSHDESGYYDIYVMDANGDNHIRLTESGYNSQHPEWSPDGSKIIYSEQFHSSDIYDIFPSFYIMGIDGSNPTRVTEGISYEYRASWSPLELNIHVLGEVIRNDALDPDILLGSWQGEYEDVTIEYRFSDERLELTSPDTDGRVEYRVSPYFLTFNLEYYNSLLEQWANYGRVEVIDQDNIIIRDNFLYHSLSDDYMKSYIEVPCARVGGEDLETSLDAQYRFDYESGTIPLSDLPVGSRVADPTWEWEFRLGYNYTNEGAYGMPTDLGDKKPVTWIVAAINHYDIDQPHVTLIAEELIGFHTFDDSTHIHERGSSHWGDSGTHSSAGYGLRPWLNSTGIHEGEGFYQAFSDNFARAIITTSLPNYDSTSNLEYFTNDKIFIPSTTELGDTEHAGSYETGSAYAYFKDSDPAKIAASLNNSLEEYWTRSSSTHRLTYEYTLNIVKEDGEFGIPLPGHFDWLGIRPVLNLDAGTMVSEVEN